MYKEAYKPLIYPVPGPHAWTKTNTPDIVPPVIKINRGRKQEKRRKGKFELPKPKDTSRMGRITCSNCKLQGHKYTSCTKDLRPDLQMRKNKHVPNRGEDGPSPVPPVLPPRQAPALPVPPQRQAPAPPVPPQRQAPAPPVPPQRQAPVPPVPPPRQAPYGLDGEPSYRRSRTWAYLNCGYRAEQGQEDGPSNF